jgi:hypothetical protein
MAEAIDYIHLAPREGSGYQPYFIKGVAFWLRRSSARPSGPSPWPPMTWREITTRRSLQSEKQFSTASATRFCVSGSAKKIGPRAEPAA